MANRTLRRAYTQANGSSNGSAEVSGVEPVADDSELGGNEDADIRVDGNGEESERESDSNGSIGYVTIDPADLRDFIGNGGTDANSNGNRTRKPRSDSGQKRGTRGPRKKSAEIPTLVTVHNLLNSWGQFLFKELELDPTEKEKLDAALANFAEYHELPLLSPKRASELELLNALAMAYGPRIFCIYHRMEAEAKIKKAKNVTHNPFVVTQHPPQDSAVQ